MIFLCAKFKEYFESLPVKLTLAQLISGDQGPNLFLCISSFCASPAWPGRYVSYDIGAADRQTS